MNSLMRWGPLWNIWSRRIGNMKSMMTTCAPGCGRRGDSCSHGAINREGGSLVIKEIREMLVQVSGVVLDAVNEA